MIDYKELVRRMEIYLSYEQDNKEIEVSADTLENALHEASIELETSIKDLDYEVIKQGSNGYLGFNKKNWVISAYKSLNVDTSLLFDEEPLCNNE